MTEVNRIKVITPDELQSIFAEPFASATLGYIHLISSLWNGKIGKNHPDEFFVVAGGRKYLKIANTTARWVHSFVEISTGDIYMAESWDRPAKGIRGNIYRDSGREALTEIGQVRYLVKAYMG